MNDPSDKTVPDGDDGQQVDFTTDFEFSIDDASDETFGFNSEVTKASSDSSQFNYPSQVGRYELKQVLGQGAFGAVLLGYDSQLGRQVAVKLPHLETATDSQWDIEGEFLQEAQQLAQLTHPNIVSIFDVGVEEGLCYIVADFLDGVNLKRWLDDHRPSWQETARIVAAIADALAAAHAKNTIHRDVKPANILLCDRAEGPVPVLVDFGLALSEATKLQRGKVSGTPNYMSPEQVRGQSDQIDGRTDIYSLGVVLYYMLSRRMPFATTNVRDLLKRVLNEEARPPRQFVHSIPREMERICLKAMAKDVAERYNTAGDMAAELRGVLKQDEATAQAAASGPSLAESRTRESVRILIADDHELTRLKLQTDLEKWGHEVVAAEDGQQAWELFQQGQFEIVISDWMMPEVDGIELVKRIRGSEHGDYVYIIMLTARAERHDLVTGMSAGADDFLAKPFQRDELQVRLRAGVRITKLNRELRETNRRLNRSLEAAAKIQEGFLPTNKPSLPGFDVAWNVQSCPELGGDIFNVIQLDDRHLAVYVLDVAGEGIPAVLLATSLSRALSTSENGGVLLVERSDQGSRIRPPHEVIQQLNRDFGHVRESQQFFSVIYGVLDVSARQFTYANAGHPAGLYLPAGRPAQMLDADGYPIGMMDENDEVNESVLQLQSGDRIVLHSDGLADAMSPDGEVFGIARIIASCESLRDASLDSFNQALLTQASQWRGDNEPTDDTSIISLQIA